MERNDFQLKTQDGAILELNEALLYFDKLIGGEISTDFHPEELAANKNELITDLFISDIRREVQDFYKNYYQEELIEKNISEVCQNLNDRINEYVQTIFTSFHLVPESSKPSIFDWIMNELLFASRRFAFLAEEFKVKQVFLEKQLPIHVQFSFAAVLDKYEAPDYSIFKKAGKDWHKDKYREKWKVITGYFELSGGCDIFKKDIYTQLSQLADDYFEKGESRYSVEFHAVETVNEMIDLLTDFIWENKDDNRNEVVTVFAAFNHLFNHYSLNKYVDQDIYEERIYGYIEDKGFVEYLEKIREHKWDQAISLNKEYDIPYYYKLLNIFFDVDSLSKLNNTIEENFFEITDCYNHIGLLFENLQDYSCDYLPTLAQSNFPDVDLHSAISERKKYMREITEKNEQLDEKNKELKELNAQLEGLIHKNRKMVDDFSHSWTNILKPDLVYKVAEVLRKDSRYRNEYIALIRAYNDEVLAANECQLLKLTHSDHSKESREQLRMYFKEGILEDKSRNGADIDYIINYALSRTLFRLFYEQHSDRIQFIQESFANRGMSLAELGEEFDHFLQTSENSTEHVLEWFNGQSSIFDIHVEKDENWEKLYLDKNKGVTTFLITRFMELFINAFTYGSKDAEHPIVIKLSTVEKNFYEFLTIRFENRIGSTEPEVFEGGKKGLEASEEIIKMLNADLLEDETVTFFDSGYGSENTFYVEMLIDKYLLLGEGEE